MVVFGVELELSPTFLKFFKEMNRKIQRKDLLKSPFTKGSGVKIYNSFLLFQFYNIYPNLVLFSLLFIIPFFIFDPPIWVLLGGVPFLFIGFTHTKLFYFLMLIWALKKKKYKGRIKLLKDQEIIRRLSKCAKAK